TQDQLGAAEAVDAEVAVEPARQRNLGRLSSAQFAHQLLHDGDDIAFARFARVGGFVLEVGRQFRHRQWSRRSLLPADDLSLFSAGFEASPANARSAARAARTRSFAPKTMTPTAPA